VRRSARQGFVERVFLPLLRLHPFLCINCYKRFYSRSQPIRVELREPEIVAHSSAHVRDHLTANKKVPVQSKQAERRCFSRLGCGIPARLVAGSEYCVTGIVSSISLNGCFIQTSQGIPVGSAIELTMDIGEGTRVRALVRRTLPSTGMGVEFTDMTVPNFRRLRSIARDSVRLRADL
jgi:hypothetical protein